MSNEPKQEMLFDANELNHLDSRVRMTFIGDEQFVSILDVLEYHGNKKNPRQAWKNISEYMVKQGISNSPDFGQYAFEGSDGKRKAKTPVMNLRGFYRFTQSADIPEWEHIRQWQAQLGELASKSKAEQDRLNSIKILQDAGFGDHPHTLWKIAHNETISEQALLKKAYARLIDNPDYPELTNTEYLALFGLKAKQLKAILQTENIKSKLGTQQLETIAFAAKQLRYVLSEQGEMTNERAKLIIHEVIDPIGVYMRGIAQLMGKDHITGKPLLPIGK